MTSISSSFHDLRRLRHSKRFAFSSFKHSVGSGILGFVGFGRLSLLGCLNLGTLLDLPVFLLRELAAFRDCIRDGVLSEAWVLLSSQRCQKDASSR
jgi:hypothetical protein